MTQPAKHAALAVFKSMLAYYDDEFPLDRYPHRESMALHPYVSECFTVGQCRELVESLTAEQATAGDDVLPCDFNIGPCTLRAGVSMKLAQEKVTRLFSAYLDTQMPKSLTPKADAVEVAE